MVNPGPFNAAITHDKSAGDLALENGLARRVIRSMKLGQSPEVRMLPPRTKVVGKVATRRS